MLSFPFPFLPFTALKLSFYNLSWNFETFPTFSLQYNLSHNFKTFPTTLQNLSCIFKTFPAFLKRFLPFKTFPEFSKSTSTGGFLVGMYPALLKAHLNSFVVALYTCTMAIRVVEFSNGVYEIRKIFA